MKKLSFLLLGLLTLNSLCSLQAQSLKKNTSVIGICYAGNKIKKIYIPPPDEFYKKSGSKGGGSIKIFYTGFPNKAQVAMNYAASILESMLPADTKLTVVASWEIISSPGVLAQTLLTGLARGWDIDALNPMAFYPIALAEKIAGKSLNDSLQGDIQLKVNSTQQWYLGTDGLTGAGKYDLVTVVLHEICHGLGFFDSMTPNGTDRSYGFLTLNPDKDTVLIPMIYDTFIENQKRKKLTDTLNFINPSPGLNLELTGGQLYFTGPVLNEYAPGSRTKIYAPPIWDAGSSISHLDEYSTPDTLGLMTPFIDFREAIHNPGKLTFSILGDLGWINTRIIHTTRGDTEEHLTELELSARIKSDTSYNHEKVGVVFSFDKFQTSDTLFMTSPNSNDVFNSLINIPSYNSELQYYFFVEDHFLRLYRSPSLFEKIPYKVYIGIDTVKPVISHTAKGSYLETQLPDTLNFKATVTDNLGIDSVYIEYKINESPSKYFGLKAGKADSYSKILNTKPELLKGGDSIQYRIFAVDSALIPNTSVLPKTGYSVIHIERILSTLESYSTDFSGVAADFYNNGFNISKPEGFNKSGLHTKHPYESPEVDDGSIQYTALLRHPLKLDVSGILINFNEIVLVEPGETGSVYGSTDFYDYVVLEGSKNFGKTWFSLADGYDCRLVSSWETAYNNSIVGGNSTFVPTETMLQKHTIYYRPSDKISAGDTLLVRFRLYSDPYANGWGWVIEDLKIGPLVDAIEKVSYDQVKVYPNPGNGLINISNTTSTGNDNSKPMRYSIYNSAGICIIKDKTSGNSGTMVDISRYPTGMYIIVLYIDDGLKTIKYSLIK
jgi:hypothetical protein